MNKSPALQFLHDLLSDLADPNFIWQVAGLALCLALASLFARWWGRRQDEASGRLRQAGARLAFPLAAVLLVGLALLVARPFIHVNLLKLALPLLGSMALVRGVVFVLRQTFHRAAWLAAWERIIAAVVWGWLALYITDLAPYVIDALQEFSFSVGKQKIDLWMLLHGAITVLLTVVLALWVAGVIEQRLMAVETLDSSVRIVGVRVAKALLAVFALLFSLSLVGIDMTALSVFTGALGVGLGMGLQRIASNYVSGFIILLDRSIRLGNIVQVGGEAGSVMQITTRYTVLRHTNGSESLVPNEMLIGNVVQNQSYSDERLRLSCALDVAYGSDLDQAMQLMIDAAVTHPRVLAEPAPQVFLLNFGDSGIRLELGFWIADVAGGKGNVVSDINLAIWRAFKAAGVEIPFPQREVRLLGTPPQA